MRPSGNLCWSNPVINSASRSGGLRRLRERSEETVDVATITDVHDDNDQASLFNLVDDTIVSTSDPVEVIHSLEFLDAGRTGNLG